MLGILIFAGFSINSFSAAADNTEAIQAVILQNGIEVHDVFITPADKTQLLAALNKEGVNSYQWQIFTADQWVDIYNEKNDALTVSYSLISNALNSGNKAKVRCKIKSGSQEILSDAVTVFAADYDSSDNTNAVSESEALFIEDNIETARKAAVSDNPGDLATYTVTVDYYFTNGRRAAESYVAVVAGGSYLSATVKSPVIVGYTAMDKQSQDGAQEALNVVLNYSDIQSDITVEVWYHPQRVRYQVEHYRQNISDDNYTIFDTVLTSDFVGNLTNAEAKSEINGFYVLPYENIEIAADGSTVVEIYYDREYYLMIFKLDGGYGVEPLYARYGTPVSVPAPSKPGYVFVGWHEILKDEKTGEFLTNPDGSYMVGELTSVHDTVPDEMTGYLAEWERSSAGYTVVYWAENADDDNYSFWGYRTSSAQTGTYISGSDSVRGATGVDNDEIQYFTYNNDKTDKNVYINGDGSAIVNVYYKRNTYTMTFKGTNFRWCGKELHEHVYQPQHPEHLGGCYDNAGNLICEVAEHAHSDSCYGQLICGKEEHLHSSDCCSLREHIHGNSCVLNCVHVHTLACYGLKPDTEPFTPSRSELRKFEGFTGGVENGYLYCARKRNTVANYYLYFNNNWYQASDLIQGEETDNNSGILNLWNPDHFKYTAIPVRCGHIAHEDACYQCGQKAHIHGDGNCDCFIEEHIHDSTCREMTCDREEHAHECDITYILGCLDNNGNLICGKEEHREHTRECYLEGTVREYSVTAKYDADIQGVWESSGVYKSSPVFYYMDDGYLANSSITGDYYAFLAKMPGQDITMTLTKLNGSSKTWYYYLELLDGQDETGLDIKEDGGRRYYLYHTSTATGIDNLTYDEDYFPISGFQQRDNEVPSFNRNNEAYLYYTRSVNLLSFYNRGTYLPQSSQIPFGTDISSRYFVPPYPSNVEENAYEFKGWYTTPDCIPGSEYDFEDAVMPGGSLALYARWDPKIFTVRLFDTALLGNQLGEEMTVRFGSQISQPPIPPPPYDNVSFIGWFYMDGGMEHAIDFEEFYVKNNLDIYAKWSAASNCPYTIKYMFDGTEIAAPIHGYTKAGNNRTFEAKTGKALYSGYQTGYYPLVSSHTVLMQSGEETVNEYVFKYVKKAYTKYTVYYRDAVTGVNLIEPKVVDNNTDAIVTENFAFIPNYVADSYQKRLVISADDEANIIVFNYSSDAGNKNAPYAVIHYVQNAEDDDYTVYQSSNHVSLVGDRIDVSPMMLSGFEYDAQKSTSSGILTESGLKLELYYDRCEYPFTVHHIDYETGEPLINAENGMMRYGATLVRKALGEDELNKISKSHYSVYGSDSYSRTISIEDATEAVNNIITFYYTENRITFTYTAIVSPAGFENFGAVSIKSENVRVMSDAAQGSVPTESAGFAFEGWYMDNACTLPVPESWVNSENKLIPRKNSDGIYDGEHTDFYAKFTPLSADLTIIKSGAEDLTQTFVYRISGSYGMEMYVTITGNGSATVNGLPFGTYTITEQNSWSWRYSNGSDSVEKAVNHSDTDGSVISFGSDKTGKFWLSGNSLPIKNVFGTNGEMVNKGGRNYG